MATDVTGSLIKGKISITCNNCKLTYKLPNIKKPPSTAQCDYTGVKDAATVAMKYIPYLEYGGTGDGARPVIIAEPRHKTQTQTQKHYGAASTHTLSHFKSHP